MRIIDLEKLQIDNSGQNFIYNNLKFNAIQIVIFKKNSFERSQTILSEVIMAMYDLGYFYNHDLRNDFAMKAQEMLKNTDTKPIYIILTPNGSNYTLTKESSEEFLTMSSNLFLKYNKANEDG